MERLIREKDLVSKEEQRARKASGDSIGGRTVKTKRIPLKRSKIGLSLGVASPDTTPAPNSSPTSENLEDAVPKDRQLSIDDEDDDVKTEDAPSLFRKLKILERQFLTVWSDNLVHMKKIPFDSKEDRLSPRMYDRIITVGGLTWNKDSQSMRRDWGPTATAAAIEGLLIEMYRPDLLNTKNCPGACSLRKALFDTFSKFSAQAVLTEWPERNGQVVSWEFADGMEITTVEDAEPGGTEAAKNGNASQVPMEGILPAQNASASQPSSSLNPRPKPTQKRQVYDADAMSKALQTARASTAPPVKKAKKAPVPSIAEVVEYLESHPYLACSAPGNPPGTVETLASICISVLVEVRTFLPTRGSPTHPFLFFLLTRSGSLRTGDVEELGEDKSQGRD